MNQKACIAGSNRPRYIYSRGQTLWSADVEINQVGQHSVSLNESEIVRDKDQIQAIGFHFVKDFIFFNDVGTDVLYRSSSEGKNLLEVTVNTRQVEGVSVDHLTNTVYWADNTLKTIMCSQLDGRFHRIVLENIAEPRGLSVDAAHGVMYFTSANNPKYIMIAALDGTSARSLLQGQSDGVDSPQGITADPRAGRVYWTDTSYNTIQSAKLDGTDRQTVYNSGPSLYDITLFEEYFTWTESGLSLQFGMTKTGEKLNDVRIQVFDYQPSVPRTYDVVTYDNYLQPQLWGACDVDNGGCDQLCHMVAPRGQPTINRKVSCSCAIGFQLQDDGKACVSELDTSDIIIFTDPYHKQVYEVPILPGSRTVKGLPMPRMDFPVSMDVDVTNGKVYWIDRMAGAIKSSYSDGKEEKTLYTIPSDARPERLVVDHVNGYLYYTDSQIGHIAKLDLEGRSHTVLNQGLDKPLGIAMNIDAGMIYWTETGAYPKIMQIKTDGSEFTMIEDKGILNPTGISVVKGISSLIYWSDLQSGKIVVYDLTKKEGRVLYENSLYQIYAIAADRDFVFFTAWNEKAVYRLSANISSEPEIVDKAVFARIYDIRVFRGLALIPTPVGGFPVVVVASAAAAAAVLLFLLLGLLAFCATKRKSKTPAVPPDENAYENDDVEREYLGFNNDTLFDIRNAHANHGAPPAAPPPPPVTTNGHGPHSTGGMHQGHGTGFENGHADPSLAAVAGVPTMLTLAKDGKRVKKKRGNELPEPQTDPSFELTMGNKATIIQRMVNRMRNRLSTIRWSGDDDGSGGHKRGGRRTAKDIIENKKANRSSQENYAYETDGEESGNVEGGPTNRRNIRKGPIKIEPQLHRPPRGFAPASHSVPIQVKNTWGRAKHAHVNKKS